MQSPKKLAQNLVKVPGKLPDRKSIKSDYPKTENQLIKLDNKKGQLPRSKRKITKKKRSKIDFYDHDKVKVEEEQKSQDEVADEVQIVATGKEEPLKSYSNPPLTIQRIPLESEYATSSETV